MAAFVDAAIVRRRSPCATGASAHASCTMPQRMLSAMATEYTSFCVQHGVLYTGASEDDARAAAASHVAESPRCDAFDNMALRTQPDDGGAFIRRLPDEEGSGDYARH